MDPLGTAFHETCKANELFPPGTVVLSACSGGLDSICLLNLLAGSRDELGISVVAGVVDHRLREFGDESRLIARRCEALGVEHRQIKLDAGMPDRAKVRGLSLEHAARDERYCALAEMAAAAGALCVACGHHADDQAETLIIRVLRGTGLAGLGGMRRIGSVPGGDIPLVRPLLGFRRRDLEEYAVRNGLEWADDPTNSSKAFQRNRIRSELIPVLECIAPDAVKTMSRSAAVLGEQVDAVNALLDENLRPSADIGPHRVSVPIVALAQGGLRKLLLARLFSYLGTYPPEACHFQLLAGLLDGRHGSARLDLPGGLVAVREYSTLTIAARPGEEDGGFGLVVEGEGVYPLSGGEVRVSAAVPAPKDLPCSPDQAYFDAALLRFPLVLRSWCRGDRMQPFGMDGSRKVSDLLGEARTPSAQRRQVPLLVDSQGAILWVAGIRRSTHCPAKSGRAAYLFSWI